MFLPSFSELSSPWLPSPSRSHGPWAGGREPLDLHLCLGMRCLVSAEEYLAPPNGWRPQLAPEADICAWCTCVYFCLACSKPGAPPWRLPSCWGRPLSLWHTCSSGPSYQPCRLLSVSIQQAVASQMSIHARKQQRMLRSTSWSSSQSDNPSLSYVRLLYSFSIRNKRCIKNPYVLTVLSNYPLLLLTPPGFLNPERRYSFPPLSTHGSVILSPQSRRPGRGKHFFEITFYFITLN